MWKKILLGNFFYCFLLELVFFNYFFYFIFFIIIVIFYLFILNLLKPKKTFFRFFFSLSGKNFSCFFFSLKNFFSFLEFIFTSKNKTFTQFRSFHKLDLNLFDVTFCLLRWFFFFPSCVKLSGEKKRFFSSWMSFQEGESEKQIEKKWFPRTILFHMWNERRKKISFFFFRRIVSC